MASYDVHRLEREWQAAWERAGCHSAPDVPQGRKFFVHDSTPFPNGPLHLGHVRTYLLGDMTARYQRLRGKCVLYHSGFDSFGLPIELEALEQGITPRQLVQKSIEEQTRQLRRLGISYDWSRMADTSRPETYRWTQWLFLEMVESGLVERREAPLNWCPRCETALARLQVEDGGCWRCGSAVETRTLPQWFVLVSRYAPQLRRSLDDLHGWSRRVRHTLAGILDEDPVPGRARGQGGTDWLVSRQRSWGTPIPMIFCDACGPVPASELPVILPDGLDWASGSGALSRCEAFVETSCPKCRSPARRETDTLDCLFDDLWCFFQTLVLQSSRPGFTRENLNRWHPVDLCQSGLDTFSLFHFYRFLGVFLHERGLIDHPDYIRGFLGNDLILADGRKMSKHLGNAVAPEEILTSHGADVLRVAMFWAAGPQRPLHWQPKLLEKAIVFLEQVHRLYQELSQTKTETSTQSASKKVLSLQRQTRATLSKVGRFIEEYRPNAAVETLANLLGRIRAFALHRAQSGRLKDADATVLQEILGSFATGLAPFAPHLAEEVWHMTGRQSLVANACWPEDVRQER